MGEGEGGHGRRQHSDIASFVISYDVIIATSYLNDSREQIVALKMIKFGLRLIGN